MSLLKENEEQKEESKNEFFENKKVSKLPPLFPIKEKLPNFDDRNKYFYLQISGLVEKGYIFESDGICVKYQFVRENDWSILNGLEWNVSQHAFKSYSNKKSVTWNLPFEVAYRSLNPRGWPKIILSCSGPDFFGREINIAFGGTHVPTQPGRFCKKAYCKSPFIFPYSNNCF